MKTLWSYADGIATASDGHWSISVDQTNPQTGAMFQCGSAAWLVFSVNPKPSHACIPVEAYARQNDLIAQYVEGDSDTYRFHLYWRLLCGNRKPTACAMAAELWLGVQTGLLDSTPLLEVCCQPAQLENAGPSWQSYTHAELCEHLEGGERTPAACDDAAAALVLKTPDSTAVWLIEPSDQCHTQIVEHSNQHGGAAALQIFGHFMEKGVIRRGRMQFLIYESNFSIEQLRTAYQAFAESELPLTA